MWPTEKKKRSHVETRRSDDERKQQQTTRTEEEKERNRECGACRRPNPGTECTEATRACAAHRARLKHLFTARIALNKIAMKNVFLKPHCLC